MGWIGILLWGASFAACSNPRAELVEVARTAAFEGPWGQRVSVQFIRVSSAGVPAEVAWDEAVEPVGWRARWRGPNGVLDRPELEIRASAGLWTVTGGRPPDRGRFGLELTPPSGWRLEAPSEARHQDSLVLGVWEGPKGSRQPDYQVRRSRPPRLDGRLGDRAWQGTPMRLSKITGGTVDPRRPTRAWLAWDDAALYAAFEAVDPDVTERFQRRDDPIYEHEAVELFLMPDRDGPYEGPYIELQASPGGVRFDARFVGPRRGMDRSFDAGYEVVTRVDGDLAHPGGDRKWISEWRIPWSSLGGRPAPEGGDVWRANLFRIDRSRGLPDEYQAWSPPMAGDFHRSARFGFLEFTDGT